MNTRMLSFHLSRGQCSTAMVQAEPHRHCRVRIVGLFGATEVEVETLDGAVRERTPAGHTLCIE